MDPKELRGLVEAYSEVYTPQEEIKEASYSAKAARAGKDIGKPGKMFAKIAKSAAKRYGSEERGKKVAGAVLAKLRSEEIEVLEDMLDEAVKGASRHDTEMRKAAASERRSGVKNRLSPSEGRQNAAKMERDVKYMDKLTKNNKIIVGMAHEEVSVFDVVLEFLQAEGFAETLEEAEWMMANMIDEEAIDIILELTGGKGHPGYKAGSRDLGPMQAGHPADSRKRQVKGGTMSQRHGFHLGDIDDDDDDEDDYESIVKQQSRDKRETVRKPLRDKVKAARKVLSKEDYVNEAQHARNNPEKYERKQDEKYAPVRGERTPMPPRGDRRREDFEKWYAANVR